MLVLRQAQREDNKMQREPFTGPWGQASAPGFLVGSPMIPRPDRRLRPHRAANCPLPCSVSQLIMALQDSIRAALSPCQLRYVSGITEPPGHCHLARSRAHALSFIQAAISSSTQTIRIELHWTRFGSMPALLYDLIWLCRREHRTLKATGQGPTAPGTLARDDQISGKD
jgi:hypothetical protein